MFDPSKRALLLSNRHCERRGAILIAAIYPPVLQVIASAKNASVMTILT
jgi:hypothetical protein